MSTCLILGGGGYIGHNWAKRLAARKRFARIVLADVRPPSGSLDDICEFVKCDVRQPLSFDGLKPEWLFNFAAVHREPGHEREEYFDTNIAGANHACTFAEQSGCRNILFTSSIAVYGALKQPTSEASPLYPYSPYGISKLCAELIFKGWQRSGAGRRLHICRPGVIYGPGDPGNILRMIRAVRKGYFIFPGSRHLRKSYGYIEGLLDSFEFVMAQEEKQLTYNYVERETETLGTLVQLVQAHLGKRTPTLTAPLPVLTAAAALTQLLTGGRSPIHPVRVRKTASSTHVVPEALLKLGFEFRYDFAASLKDWAKKSPEDFR
ncbi:MAG: NAD-dependent epimerase/dehydratase family protein [Verrucomicrobiae bacterium]|nr:NAD-dependent epimerase/dehydratase family protein [Verrucomicrobiae bacterium]